MLHFEHFNAKDPVRIPTPQQHWNFYFSSRIFYTEIQTHLSEKENFNMKFNEIGNLKLKVKFNNLGKLNAYYDNCS